MRAKAEELAAKAFKNAENGFKLRAELPWSRHRERGCGQRFSNSRQGKTNCGRRFRIRGRRPERNGGGGSWPAGGRIIARPIARLRGCGEPAEYPRFPHGLCLPLKTAGAILSNYI